MNRMIANPAALVKLTTLYLALAMPLSALRAGAQSQAADPQQSGGKAAEAKPAGARPCELPHNEVLRTFYLTNLTQPADLNDVQTAMRNVLTRAKLYAVPTQAAIVMWATPEEIAVAQKIISDLDQTKKIYRLIYTVTETDGGKRIGVQHYSMIVASGSKTNLKQGSKVPLVVASGTANSNSPVTYIDVGLDIESDLDSYFDGVRLRSKIVQSGLAEDKSADAMHGDPVIRQTVLEGTSTLIQGKPQVLGSLDNPGSTRHQEIEVVSELVR